MAVGSVQVRLKKRVETQPLFFQLLYMAVVLTQEQELKRSQQSILTTHTYIPRWSP